MPDPNTDNNQANRSVQSTGTNRQFPKILIIIVVAGVIIVGGLAWGYSSGVFNFLGINKNTSNNNMPVASLPPLTETQKLESAKAPEGMVYVPDGEFMAGTPKNQAYPESYPLQKIYLSSFYIDKYEITNGQFQDFITKNPEWQKQNVAKRSPVEGYLEHFVGDLYDKPTSPENNDARPSIIIDGQKQSVDSRITPEQWQNTNWIKKERHNNPIVYINWGAADAYCKSANKRLPTFAEWEKAARGTDGRIYSWGNDKIYDQANLCDKNCSLRDRNTSWNDGFAYTAPVGSLPKDVSPYGAYDMMGNVAEFVQDWSGPSSYKEGDFNYFKNMPTSNPQGPPAEGSIQKMYRGNDYYDAGKFPVVIYTYHGISTDRTRNDLGFRCAKDVK